MSDELKPIAKYCVSQWDNPLDRGRYSDWNGVGEPFEVQIARAYLERLAADEAERKLSRDVRAEWMRHAGYQDQAETPQEVGTLSAEASELLAVLRIERLQDEAERVEREKPIDEAWLRSIGFGFETLNGWSKVLDRVDGLGSVCELWLSQDGLVSICQDDDHVVLTSMPDITNRGQLLDLLIALGVKP